MASDVMVTLIRRQFIVEASLDSAWEYLSRIEQWPSWALHIRRIKLSPNGPLAANSIGTIYLRNGVRSAFKMVDFNPRRNWEWSGPFLWLTVLYDHDL